MFSQHFNCASERFPEAFIFLAMPAIRKKPDCRARSTRQLFVSAEQPFEGRQSCKHDANVGTIQQALQEVARSPYSSLPATLQQMLRLIKNNQFCPKTFDRFKKRACGR